MSIKLSNLWDIAHPERFPRPPLHMMRGWKKYQTYDSDGIKEYYEYLKSEYPEKAAELDSSGFWYGQIQSIFDYYSAGNPSTYDITPSHITIKPPHITHKLSYRMAELEDQLPDPENYPKPTDEMMLRWTHAAETANAQLMHKLIQQYRELNPQARNLSSYDVLDIFEHNMEYDQDSPPFYTELGPMNKLNSEKHSFALIKTAIVRKVNNEYVLYSRKKNPKTGKRRVLGRSKSLKGIKERERQVQTFKHMADDSLGMDAQDHTLKDLSNIAVYLEEAGFIDKANKVYKTMGKVDAALDQIPDVQRNTENESHMYESGYTGGSGMFGMPEAQKLAFMRQVVRIANEFDDKGLHEESNELDRLLQELTEQDNVDMAINLNGYVGSSNLDNQGSGMFSGMSDSYFYRSYQNDEGAYEHRNETEQKLTI